MPKPTQSRATPAQSILAVGPHGPQASMLGLRLPGPYIAITTASGKAGLAGQPIALTFDAEVVGGAIQGLRNVTAVAGEDFRIGTVLLHGVASWWRDATPVVWAQFVREVRAVQAKGINVWGSFTLGLEGQLEPHALEALSDAFAIIVRVNDGEQTVEPIRGEVPALLAMA